MGLGGGHRHFRHHGHYHTTESNVPAVQEESRTKAVENRSELEQLEEQERQELLELARRVGENPTEGIFALERQQQERRWESLPLRSRIWRKLRWKIAKIPLFE